MIVAWQGGEPTMMGLDFFKRSVELVEQCRRPRQSVEYTIQANAVLIDERWAALLKENRCRVDKRGLGSFDRVMAGHEHLQQAGVDVNVVCTVHAADEERGAEVHRVFRDEMGGQFMQFVPIVKRTTETMLPLDNPGWSTARSDKRPLCVQTGAHVTEHSVSPDGYGRSLIEIFDERVRADVGEVFVQMPDVALANRHGEPPGACVFAETCGPALALEHNGDLYSCDHYVEPDHLLGNITDTPMIDLVASERQVAFGAAKRDSLPRYCRDCDVRFACHGGCPRNRFATTPDGEDGLSDLCPSYKAFFSHVDPAMRLMSRLLKQDRAPSEITCLGVPEQ